MTDLERAILHIKTRADAWAVKEIEKVLSQEPTEKPMCDRDICLSNEYNGIGCDECIVNKAEQEPCDDAISREAVIKAVDAHTNEDGTLDDDISVILEDLPSVTQTPKYWIDKDGKLYKMPDDIPSVTQKGDVKNV